MQLMTRCEPLLPPHLQRPALITPTHNPNVPTAADCRLSPAQESNPPAHEPVRACLLDLIVIEQAQAHLGPEFSYPHTSLGVLFARALRYRPIRFAFTGSPTSNAWSAWLNYQLSGTLPSLESMWSVRWNNEVIYSVRGMVQGGRTRRKAVQHASHIGATPPHMPRRSPSTTPQASDNTRYMLTGGLPGLLAPDIPVAWINTRDRVSIFDTVEPTTGVNLVSIYGDVRIALGVWPDDTNYGFIDTFTPEQLEFWQNVDIRLRATDATTESLMINTRMLDYRPPGA
jgi:hypothetical protein